MSIVQLLGIKRFDKQMAVHTVTQNTDVILELEFQNHLSNSSHKHGVLDHGKHKKCQVKKLDKQKVSCAT